jgi:hypothetical protein
LAIIDPNKQRPELHSEFIAAIYQDLSVELLYQLEADKRQEISHQIEAELGNKTDFVGAFNILAKHIPEPVISDTTNKVVNNFFSKFLDSIIPTLTPEQNQQLQKLLEPAPQ